MKRAGTEYVKTKIVSIDFAQNPRCIHGPTILFSRGDKTFYACSAYRSRKLCPFYMDSETWDQNCKRRKLDTEIKRVGKAFSRTLNKGQAQYLFSDVALKFITGILNSLEIRRVICVGTPTIHSALSETGCTESYLLDIDLQFKDFHNFSLYNMCNHYFFDEEDRLKFFGFLEHCGNKEVGIICDPPFGARLELIINTFKQIQKDLETATKCGSLNPKVFLVHPYFSEGKILKINSTLQMCDYKIEYESHKTFKNGAKSPVRIFTNVPLDLISFPASSTKIENGSTDSDQYKYCKICDKHVFRISEHCKICNRCNSKDGKPYKHCFKCSCCVKESWTHCSSCKSCHFPGNKCKKNCNSTIISNTSNKNSAKRFGVKTVPKSRKKRMTGKNKIKLQ